MKFYCVKCRENVSIPDSKTRTVRTSHSVMARSVCPHCGTGTCRILERVAGAKRSQKRSRKKSGRR